MVPAPTYKNLPVFGTGASLVQPDATTYAGGFLPGQVFPAEYENWLTNFITANSLTSQTSVINIVDEIGTVLTAAGVTPSPASTTQLYQSLNVLYATVGALASEASTRSAADVTLQNNINTVQASLTQRTKRTVETFDGPWTSTTSYVMSAMEVGEERMVAIQGFNSGGGSITVELLVPSTTPATYQFMRTIISPDFSTFSTNVDTASAPTRRVLVVPFAAGSFGYGTALISRLS